MKFVTVLVILLIMKTAVRRRPRGSVWRTTPTWFMNTVKSRLIRVMSHWGSPKPLRGPIPKNCVLTLVGRVRPMTFIQMVVTILILVRGQFVSLRQTQSIRVRLLLLNRLILPSFNIPLMRLFGW